MVQARRRAVRQRDQALSERRQRPEGLSRGRRPTCGAAAGRFGLPANRRAPPASRRPRRRNRQDRAGRGVCRRSRRGRLADRAANTVQSHPLGLRTPRGLSDRLAWRRPGGRIALTVRNQPKRAQSIRLVSCGRQSGGARRPDLPRNAHQDKKDDPAGRIETVHAGCCMEQVTPDVRKITEHS